MKELVDCLPKDSWFRDWMKVWPLAEPPKSYILFSGMAMLGAALGRAVWMDLDIHRVYPLMNLLLVGPSGIGKSTALRDIAADHLITAIPLDQRPNLLTGKSTKEAIHQDLMVAPKSIILASELANLFSKEKYNEGMVPYFTDLLDLKPARIRTKSGGSLTVVKPECCVCGGSTKAWLQDALPSNSGEGGFLPRFFIVKEDYKAQRIANPMWRLTEKERLTLLTERDRVIGEFVRLVRMSTGQIEFKDHDANDAYSNWYQTYQPDTGSMAPFAARAGAHILRLSLLIAISCGRDHIDAADINAGICLYTYAAGKLSEVVVPMSPEGKKINKVLETIGNLTMTGTEIHRAMRNYCGAGEVDRMLGDLTRDKELTLEDGKYRRKRGQS